MSSLPQPLVAYPHSMSTPPASNSKGSFGPVFIVLAVIAVLATIACIVGRLCARRLCQPKAPAVRPHTKGDLEDGFGLSIPTAKLTNLREATKGDDKLRGAVDAKKHHEIRATKEGGTRFHGATNGGAKPSK